MNKFKTCDFFTALLKPCKVSDDDSSTHCWQEATNTQGNPARSQIPARQHAWKF